MVVGMITVVVIMQTLSTVEAQRRQSSGGSSAGTAGAIALQTMQRDLLSAGAGMTGDTNTLFTTCYAQQFLAFNSQRTATNITLPVGTFAPVRVWSSDNPPAHLNAAGGGGFDTDTDMIQIISGGSSFFAGKGIDVGTFNQPIDVDHSGVSGGVGDSRWNPFPGLHSGDMVVAVQPNTDCVLGQITAISVQGRNVVGEYTNATQPGACGVGPANAARCDAPVACATAAARIDHRGAANFRNFYNDCLQVPPSPWNNSASPSLGVAFTTAKLYSLGSIDSLSVRAYAIRSGSLTVCSPLYQDCTQAAEWQVYGDGIVSMRAQMGYDADNSEAVAAGEWLNPADFNALGVTVAWRQLKAVRLVLVARGKDISRTPVDGADCAPVWAGYDTVDAACAAGADDGKVRLISGYDGGNWNRYRYKVFETTVQMRNLFWSL